MMLVEEAAPDADVLPVAALRGYLRMGSGFALAEDAAEDLALAGFLRAAIATIEARTGKVLLRRLFRMRLEEWRDRLAQPLPLAPVNSVASIEVTDASGRITTVDPGRWRLLPDMQRPLILPAGTLLPAVPTGGFITIRFCAGFGTAWSEVPADLAQAALMLAARYYEDRSDDQARAALPFAVSSLLDRWRQVRTLAGRGNRA
ncbi:head-tail connector protein [uncultured Paracoccus sp.]|uniref:head-tail connector protein n=1 Tax=uncultured Paracoccus sp. TaxID=189685 RepID=UPI00261411C4|nr:head-tail connector protein [uncultured Paracoccus sp.]